MKKKSGEEYLGSGMARQTAKKVKARKATNRSKTSKAMEAARATRRKK